MSLSFDFSTILSTAGDFVNGFLPVYSVPIGITLAIGIMGVVLAAFSGLFKRN